MKNRTGIVLFSVLVLGCFVCVSILFPSTSAYLSSFALQDKYAQNLENKLTDLLESAVGAGNVRTSVQAKIVYQDVVQKLLNPLTLAETKIHENGPILARQSVSVLINGANNEKMSAYQNLIEAAVGYDVQRGDRLSVEILPFVKPPLWTFGLNPIHLIRIAIILVFLIIGGIFWLYQEKKRIPQSESLAYIPDYDLWQQAEKVSSEQLSEYFQRLTPEISAIILHHCSPQKASKIVEKFSSPYREWVYMHLDRIKVLKNQVFLLREAEKKLREILKDILKSEKCSLFSQFQNWKDEEIQNLLHYVHKDDFIKAIKTVSLDLQQIFERNIPPAQWQKLIQQIRTISCSEMESQQAQEKIVDLARLLKKE